MTENNENTNGQDLGQEVDEIIEGALEDVVEFAVDIGVGILVATDISEGEAAIWLMRMRGALVSSEQLMTSGVTDLLGAAVMDNMTEMAVKTWTYGGSLLVEAQVGSIDEWLIERGFPTASLYAVESSNIEAMGWADPHDTAVPASAVVLFKSGTLYAYDGVSEETFTNWWESESQGVYLNNEIKGTYPYRKLVG